MLFSRHVVLQLDVLCPIFGRHNRRAKWVIRATTNSFRATLTLVGNAHAQRCSATLLPSRVSKNTRISSLCLSFCGNILVFWLTYFTFVDKLKTLQPLAHAVNVSRAILIFPIQFFLVCSMYKGSSLLVHSGTAHQKSYKVIFFLIFFRA